MNGKVNSEDDISSELLNPFVHRLELATTYDKIKTALFTVVVLPLRVLAIMVLLVLAWLLACVGLLGLSDEDLRTKPMTGWRRELRGIISCIGRWSYQMGGMSLVVHGRQASRAEAPIMVIAPHSTFLDAGIVYVTGFPSIIVRRESGLNPWLGKLINYTQPVYVWREDPMSRQNSIKEIIQRATSPLDWPQVLIFPEGTCTNRSCLITFKPGAFYPGVPVQPVCIRYPNKLDTVTWTWEGPGALKLLWLTLTQSHSSCEIEFLPVYRPSEEEKKDPKLFANNVRLLMAKALGVPVSDYTYNDCRLMTRVKQMKLPLAANMLEVQKLRSKLGLTSNCVEESLVYERAHGPPAFDWSHVSYQDFARCLSVSPSDAAARHLFQLYEKEGSGFVDLREYLLAVLAVSKANSTLEMVQLAFQVYDGSGIGRLGVQEMAGALMYSLSVTREDAYDVFRQVDRQGRGYVTFAEFENYAERKTEFARMFSHCNGSHRHTEETKTETIPKKHD